MMGFYLTLFAQPALAQDARCTAPGQCVDNRVCREISAGIYVLTNEPCGSAVVGRVTPPEAIRNWNWYEVRTGSGGIGIIVFMSRIIHLLAIVAGIWVMFNFIRAGYVYISKAGESGAHAEVRDMLTWSVVGLIVIASAYAAAGIIGLLFFGDAGYILNPELTSALAP